MIIYRTRYQAEKNRIPGVEKVVKVVDGYAVMNYREYKIWRSQK